MLWTYREVGQVKWVSAQGQCLYFSEPITKKWVSAPLRHKPWQGFAAPIGLCLGVPSTWHPTSRPCLGNTYPLLKLTCTSFLQLLQTICATRSWPNEPDCELYSLGWPVLASALSLLPCPEPGMKAHITICREDGKGGGPSPLRPDSPKSFLYPRIPSQQNPRFTGKHSWNSRVNLYHVPDNSVHRECHGPPSPRQAGLVHLGPQTSRGGRQSWHLPQAAGMFSPSSTDGEVINARCHSLAGSQTGHQELGLLWEASPISP